MRGLYKNGHEESDLSSRYHDKERKEKEKGKEERERGKEKVTHKQLSKVDELRERYNPWNALWQPRFSIVRLAHD
jgi:hypothetical protein